MLNRILFAGGGAVVGALLVFVISQNMPIGMQDQRPGMPVAMEQDGSAMVDLEPEAFGTLAATPGRDQAGGGGPGMGGGGVAMQAMETSEKRVANDTMVADPAMPMPVDIMPPEWQPTNTEYLYGGETEFSLPEGTVEVLRRNGFASAGDVQGILSSLGSFLDWGTFSGMRMQSVNLVQDRSEPWAVYIDFLNGTMDLSRQLDWSKSPQARCSDPECYERTRIKPEDIPADEQVIAIANAFVFEHGVDRSSYGEPRVNDDWRRWYALAEDKMSFYAPEQVAVVYPLLINGKPVYDDYGNASGLFVSVDVRRKEAVSLTGFQSGRYERSAYDAVSDRAAFDAVLKKGGISAYWYDEAAKVVTATLGEPEESYLRHYIWNQERGQGYEIFVPALAFPVTKQANEGEQRSRVVIPLAQDLLDTPALGPILY